MRNLSTTCLIFVLIVLNGCTKDGTPADPSLFNNGFKGITYTQDDPTPIGYTDNDDWNSNGYWDFRYPIERCGSIVTPLSKQTKIDTVRESEDIPETFATSPAYPNPFNPTTAINFALPIHCNVYASIINERYKTVAVLICGKYEAGYYMVNWSAFDSNNNPLPNDIYRFIIRCTDDHGNLLFVSHGDLWLKY